MMKNPWSGKSETVVTVGNLVNSPFPFHYTYATYTYDNGHGLTNVGYEEWEKHYWEFIGKYKAAHGIEK